MESGEQSLSESASFCTRHGCIGDGAGAPIYDAALAGAVCSVFTVFAESAPTTLLQYKNPHSKAAMRKSFPKL